MKLRWALAAMAVLAAAVLGGTGVQLHRRARVAALTPAVESAMRQLTERTGEKGDRDLLVVLGLLLTASEDDVDELAALSGELPEDLRQALLSNLTVISLMDPVTAMPDPTAHRQMIKNLIERLDATTQKVRGTAFGACSPEASVCSWFPRPTSTRCWAPVTRFIP
jgi:cell division protein ZapA (FtsZ GTPase activity inhibitor)